MGIKSGMMLNQGSQMEMGREALTPDEHSTMTAILVPDGSRTLDGLVCQSLIERGFVRADVGGFVLTLAGHRLYLTTLVDKLGQ